MNSDETAADHRQGNGESRKLLLKGIASLGAKPFYQQVVQSPWNTVIDVENLQAEAKGRIHQVIEDCPQRTAPRCLTIHAPAGYGKTHLLAWTRQRLDEQHDAIFVYVPPYRPGSGSLEHHLLQSVLDALKLRSRRQSEQFNATIRNHLIKVYDTLITTRNGKNLRTGSLWQRLIWPARLKIAGRDKDHQLERLGRGFRHREFLEEAFREFHMDCLSDEERAFPDGIAADWDTFVAACLLACGDERMRWQADQWFRNSRTPLDVLNRSHITDHCRGTTKLLNALVTLNRLAEQPFCLAFDQMEDTYQAFEQFGGSREDLWVDFSILIRGLSVVPSFCMLFMFQSSIWSDFEKKIPTMLVGRMKEGLGAVSLEQLDDHTALALVRRRMNAYVWSELDSLQPPEDQPLFPFSEDEIRKLRIDSDGELRIFLSFLQVRYGELLDGTDGRSPTPVLELIHIEPSEVVSNEPTALLIRAKHLPPEVEVFFAGAPAQRAVCRPKQGEIDVTTPVGLLGEVEVRVQQVGVAENGSSGKVRFLRRELRSPYHKSIDRSLFRLHRQEMGKTQLWVAQKLGYKSAYKVTVFETGTWEKPDDDFIIKLSKLYERELISFVP